MAGRLFTPDPEPMNFLRTSVGRVWRLLLSAICLSAATAPMARAGGGELYLYLANLEIESSNDTSGWSVATLDPEFSSMNLNYTATIPFEHTQVRMKNTTELVDPVNFIIGGGQPVTIDPGETIQYEVTVGNFFDVLTTYTVSVTRTAIIADPDSDNDGMPDAYEDDNGLTVGINDAELDLDGDGLCNICEYAFGSDPDDWTDHEDPDVTLDSNGFLQISYTRAIEPSEGLIYTVEMTSDLGIWETSDVIQTNSDPVNPVWRDNINDGALPSPPVRFVRVGLTSTL